MGAPRLSGMQKQVLSLYRGFLRAARSKSPDERGRVESIVASEFRRNAKEVDKKNFLYIEYLLRRELCLFSVSGHGNTYLEPLSW